ncbi:hypothetical protein AAVH_00598 [Aphelenchoides avenae]|nr:hypothetical protein AAVH_00598 [Aphelenchus avenae]
MAVYEDSDEFSAMLSEQIRKTMETEELLRSLVLERDSFRKKADELHQIRAKKGNLIDTLKRVLESTEAMDKELEASRANVEKLCGDPANGMSTKPVHHNAENVLAKLRAQRMAKEVVLDRHQNRRQVPRVERL